MNNHTCPRCSGNKIETISKWRYVFSTFFAGMTLFIFIITIPLAILSFLSMFAMLFAPKVNKCHECKKTWKWTKEVKVNE